MFDVGFSEIILIAIAILIAVGPDDLPDILFRFGRLVRRVRMMMNNVRDQYSDIMHDAEMAHYRKEFNAKLMNEPVIDETKITGTETPVLEKAVVTVSDDGKKEEGGSPDATA